MPPQKQGMVWLAQPSKLGPKCFCGGKVSPQDCEFCNLSGYPFVSKGLLGTGYRVPGTVTPFEEKKVYNICLSPVIYILIFNALFALCCQTCIMSTNRLFYGKGFEITSKVKQSRVYAERELCRVSKKGNRVMLHLEKGFYTVNQEG